MAALKLDDDERPPSALDRARDLARLVGELWSRVTPLQLGIAWGALSVLLMLVVISGALTDVGPLPPPRPGPADAESEAVSSYRYKLSYFHAQLEADCIEYHLPKTDPEAMRVPIPAATELAREERLAGRRILSTASLQLQLQSRRLWVGAEGQGVRAPHLVLSITNLTPYYLAYRVDTRVAAGCEQKAAIEQNALALKPHQQLFRSECVLRQADSLIVERIEVMRVPALAYYYLSRLDPPRLRLPERTSAGHTFGDLQPCRLLPWDILRTALQRPDGWRNVIDFYARHNCDEYSFFPSYRWTPGGPRALPARPPAAARAASP